LKKLERFIALFGGLLPAYRMNNKEIPAHYHHFQGGMRENVDDLLIKYKTDIDTLRTVLFVYA